jgi:hypothetical protein
MPRKVRYRCLSCGERFEVEILTDEEKREARRQNRPTSHVHCPNPECNRTDLREGWE